MNVENEIQKMTEGLKRFDPTKPERAKDEALFTMVRTRTRGAIVSAHHDLKPRDGWTEADEIIFDMVTAWYDNLKER